MIPKVIHYCWFGGKSLPNNVDKCIKSWKKNCPDYKIVQWNESNFDVNCHEFCKKAYNEKSWAFVSDFARLKVIYENGGIYLDTDVEVIKNLDDLLVNDFYVGVQQMGGLCATGLGFGAEKENQIVLDMLNAYNDVEFNRDKKNEIQCPKLNTKVLKKYGFSEDKLMQVQNIQKNSYIYPSRFFDPLAPGMRENLICSETFSIHHYSASWTNGKHRLKRKLIRCIGQDKILKLNKLLNR